MLSRFEFPAKINAMYLTYTNATKAAAITVSTRTIVPSHGSGCPISAEHDTTCFVAIALITKGKVNPAKLG